MSNLEYLSRVWEEAFDFNKQSILTISLPRMPGDKLPNGAMILVERKLRVFPHHRDSLVLALKDGHQPFVTWVRSIATDCPLATGGYQIIDSCSYGHYHTSLGEAVTEFDERYETKMQVLNQSSGHPINL